MRPSAPRLSLSFLSMLMGGLLLTACGEDPSSGSSDDPCEALGADEECYDITFTGLWTVANFPVDLPSGRHFSPMIGTAHDSSVRLWQSGTLASDGIEVMAETGGTGTLTGEIQTLIAATNATGVPRGSGIGGLESTSFSAVLSVDHPLLSLVSMVAPSPDWFVGIDSYDLRPGGVWTDSVTIPLDRVYDSGTDEGETFTSGNDDQQPPVVIERLLDARFMTGHAAIAQITLERRL